MWPWGHLAVGYVLYSLGVRARTGEAPDGWNVVALALGTQFPDLVDKPLAWWLGVLPGGRTLAHSLLVAVPLVLLVGLLARRYDAGPRATAFALGYLSHLAGDALVPALVGSSRELAFLLWPATPTVVYENPPLLADLSLTREAVVDLVAVVLAPGGFAAVVAVAASPVVLAELAVVAALAALWLVDGLPPLPEITGPGREKRDREA
jgi:membrane-bound metal-dependent hydrolase YbcI (DUF457 family)